MKVIKIGGGCLKNGPAAGKIIKLKTLHHTIIKSLIDDGNKRKQLSKDLSRIFQELERYYYGINFTR